MSGAVGQGGDGDRAHAWERRLLELSGDMLFVLDEHGRVEHCNSAAEEAVGVALEEQRGRQFNEFVDPSGLVLSPGGEPRRLDIRATRDPEQRQIFLVARDQQVGHRPIRARPGGLEWDVEEDRVTLAVAHDFANLVSVILTSAGFARDEAAPGTRLREHVDEIKHASERAADLVRWLVAFGRKDAELPKPIELTAAVRDLEGLLRRSLPANTRLDLALGPGVPPVRMDPVRLEQILLNLVFNARDALGTAGGTITVRVEPGAAGWARLVIADDGPGMSQAVAARALEPFFTTKGAGSGSGLGLATVDGIVADTGGRLHLGSAPGGGTTVVVELPVAPAPELDVADGSFRVLVVEDQAPVRGDARRILEAHGYAVVEAEDGVAALEQLDGVDLLLTDVVMPGMSGQELARLAAERVDGLQVVYMSGHAEVALGPADREGYVRKPFTAAGLLAAVAGARGRGERAGNGHLDTWRSPTDRQVSHPDG